MIANTDDGEIVAVAVGARRDGLLRLAALLLSLLVSVQMQMLPMLLYSSGNGDTL